MSSVGVTGLRKRPHRQRAIAVFGALLWALAFGLSARLSGAEAVEAVALAAAAPPSAEPAADAPAVLSTEDAALYRRAFDLQDAGRWADADRLIKQIQDPLLIGHLRFQRYMHPSAYRSNFGELSGWLKSYADHPGAARLYKLALKRQPANAAAPRKPVPSVNRALARDRNKSYRSARARTVEQRREAAALQRAVSRANRLGHPERAEKQLWAAEKTALLDPVEFDSQLARVAARYFYQGNDEKALALARIAAERSRDEIHSADWIAGLAAWRIRDYERAAEHFEAMIASQDGSRWSRSAAAFWAARANLVIRRPERVNQLLTIAAAHPRTFYGLIASRQLAADVPLAWDQPPLAGSDLETILRLDGVRRAIALVSVGREHLAEQELRLAWGRSAGDLVPALLGLATRLNLPASQIRLGNTVAATQGRIYDSALYPVPNWRPTGGFQVDPALIYAFARQESRFITNAKSHAGARGLMQLMPATASYVAQDRSLRSGGNRKLESPELNLDLGQRYIRHLMELEWPGDNLLLLAAAYNGGPGNLAKWLKRYNRDDDWLLFIESIPAEETRNYVERVMANFWIYRARMGLPNPSLDAIAAGEGPRYIDPERDNPYKSAHANYVTPLYVKD